MIYVYVIGLIISVAAWMVIFVQSLRGKNMLVPMWSAVDFIWIFHIGINSCQ